MLDCYEFGRQLIETGDLDPVYTLVYRAEFEPEELHRWLLAYCCFYHVGTASWISDGGKDRRAYWNRMRTAAASKDYPRSRERRHFRGANAVGAVEWLAERDLEYLFGPLTGFGLGKPQVRTHKLSEVIAYVGKWRQFGPWISFKVADLLERIGAARIEVDDAAAVLYESPRQGAADLWEAHNPGLDPSRQGCPALAREPGGVSAWALELVEAKLKDLKAPPRFERPVNAQEAETVLCKWHAYLNGHYRIGEDVEACRKGLLRFAKCRTSQRLLTAGKRGRLW